MLTVTIAFLLKLYEIVAPISVVGSNLAGVDSGSLILGAVAGIGLGSVVV